MEFGVSEERQEVCVLLPRSPCDGAEERQGGSGGEEQV